MQAVGDGLHISFCIQSKTLHKTKQKAAKMKKLLPKSGISVIVVAGGIGYVDLY